MRRAQEIQGAGSFCLAVITVVSVSLAAVGAAAQSPHPGSAVHPAVSVPGRFSPDQPPGLSLPRSETNSANHFPSLPFGRQPFLNSSLSQCPWNLYAQLYNPFAPFGAGLAAFGVAPLPAGVEGTMYGSDLMSWSDSYNDGVIGGASIPAMTMSPYLANCAYFGGEGLFGAGPPWWDWSP